MTDDTKELNAENEVRKALAALEATNAALRAELDATRRKMTQEKARIEFTEAMEKADARPQAKEFGLRLLMSEVRNVRLTDDGALVASLGDLEGATPDELVTAFIEQNDFLQKVVTADGLDTSAIAAKPLDVKPLHTDSSGNAIPLGELSADELLDAAGTPPAAMFTGKGQPPGWFRHAAATPKPKPAPARPLTDADRELSADELFQRAGEPPWQR